MFAGYDVSLLCKRIRGKEHLHTGLAAGVQAMALTFEGKAGFGKGYDIGMSACSDMHCASGFCPPTCQTCHACQHADR